MALAKAHLGAVLTFEDKTTLTVHEDDILTNITYKKGKETLTIDEGRVRVICARTTAYAGGPTDCPPEPYMHRYIFPTMLIIDYSTENVAQIARIQVEDIISIDGVLDPEAIPEVLVGGEDSPFETLQEAIDAVEAGVFEGVLTLAADVEENLVIKGDVVINLNGHTVSAPNLGNTTPYNHTFYVDGGNLVIEGEGLVTNCNNQGYCVFNAGPDDSWTPGRVPAEGRGMGTVTIDGGTFRHLGEDKAHHAYLIVNHGAMMVINDGEFGMVFDDSSLITNGYQSSPACSPIMEINGGTFYGGRHTVNNDHGGRLTVNGGDFTMGELWTGDVETKPVGSGPKNALRNEADSTAVVTGGTFVGNIENTNPAEKSLVISGGTFDADVTAYLAAGYKQTNGKVTK